MTDEPVGPLAIDLKLLHLEALPGGYSKLFVWVRLPPHRSETKVFLQFSKNLRSDGIQFAAPWSANAALRLHWPNEHTSRFDGQLGKQEDINSGAADTHTCLLDIVPALWVVNHGDYISLENGENELLLEWSTVLHVNESAKLGEVLRINLWVYTNGINDSEHKSTHIVVGNEQRASEPVDFLIGPRVILTASEHVVLHGLSTRPLADVRKQYPSLYFSYSVDGEVAAHLIDHKSVHLGEGDRSFSVQLPETAFLGGGQDGLTVKRYRAVILSIHYTDNSGKVHNYPSQSFTIMIDNRKPVFVNPKLSVSQAEGGMQFVVKGQIQGPDSSPFTGTGLTIHDNPVTDVAICWNGDVANPVWNKPKLVPGHGNLWEFTLFEQSQKIMGTLNPVVIAKTEAGVQQTEHLTFSDIRGLILINAAVKGGVAPISFQYPDEQNTQVHSLTVKPGQSFDVEFRIAALVSISRMNVFVVLKNNKPIESDLPELRTLIGRDQKKSPTVSPALLKGDDISRLNSWNGSSNRQVLSLHDFAKNKAYTVSLPLIIAQHAAIGPSWDIELLFKDPATGQPTFTDQSCLIRVNVG